MAPLRNCRQERFAQLMAEGRTAAEAYGKAGYKPDAKNAHRLRTNEDILTRVAEIQKRGAEQAEITLADVTASLIRIARAAESEGGAAGLSVARAAWMDVAKINGLVVEKSESVNIVHTISDDPMSEGEWESAYGASNAGAA